MSRLGLARVGFSSRLEPGPETWVAIALGRVAEEGLGHEPDSGLTAVFSAEKAEREGLKYASGGKSRAVIGKAREFD